MSKLVKILCLLSMVILISLSFSSDLQAQVDKIKVAVMYSMSGAGAPIGKIQLDGAKLAIKEVNDQGGILLGGKKVKVEAVIRDDETKPDVAVR
ncbi:MAG: ABC transporter substrate-binding protein, partial [bacterium]